jgi:hypothetical protein
MKTTVFWDVTLCSPLKVNRRFVGIYRRVFATCYHPGILLGFFDPKDGGDMFYDTSVDFQRTTRRYIPEDSTFQTARLSHKPQSLKNDGGMHRQMDNHRRIHRRQGDHISVLLFFQSKDGRLGPSQTWLESRPPA